MIYFPKTKGEISHELPAVGTFVAEGQCALSSTIAGVFGVTPSTGSDSAPKVFMGFSVCDQMSLVSFPKVEEFVLGAGAVKVLERVPTGSTLLVYDVTLAAVLVTGSGSGVDGWTLTSDSLAIVNTKVGNTFRVFYRFAPTAIEAQLIQGDIRPGGPAALILDRMGILKSGVIYTSEYDTAVNWLATNPAMITGADGRVTITGTGTGLAINGEVISAPNVTDGPNGAFLGIEFTAA